MKYSKHSLTQNSNKKLITDWAYSEGVFLTPRNMYIARVKIKGNYVTLSQHKTKEEATKVYNDYYKNN